jgi:hypothetical protein
MTRLLEKMHIAHGIFSPVWDDNKLSFQAISDGQIQRESTEEHRGEQQL